MLSLFRLRAAFARKQNRIGLYHTPAEKERKHTLLPATVYPKNKAASLIPKFSLTTLSPTHRKK